MNFSFRFLMARTRFCFARVGLLSWPGISGPVTAGMKNGLRFLMRKSNCRIPGSKSAYSMKEIVRQATAGIERDLIIQALDETRGNVTRAAHLLRISRKGLQNKMKEFGLRDPENKS